MGSVRGGLVIAVLLGVLPTAGRAEVNVNINIGAPPPQIVIAEPPRLVLVPRSPVYYAPSVDYNFFYYGGRYYTYTNDAWFWGVSVRGPWSHIEIGSVPRPILAVPVTYYKVPPGHWKRYGRPPWGHYGHRYDDDHSSDDDDHGHGHGHGRGHGHRGKGKKH